MEGVSEWDNFIRRVLPFDNRVPVPVRDAQVQDVQHLCKILEKMANPKKTELMLSLLHLIIDTDRLWAPMCGVGVIVSCLCNTPHPVSDDTFLLLEEVESGLGSADQKTEKTVVSISSGTPIFFLHHNRFILPLKGFVHSL